MISVGFTAARGYLRVALAPVYRARLRHLDGLRTKDRSGFIVNMLRFREERLDPRQPGVPGVVDKRRRLIALIYAQACSHLEIAVSPRFVRPAQ
jgi:hypothetical protein